LRQHERSDFLFEPFGGSRKELFIPGLYKKATFTPDMNLLNLNYVSHERRALIMHMYEVEKTQKGF